MHKADKVNAADLAAAIIEAQKENKMEDLSLDLSYGHGTEPTEKLPIEVTRLVNALVNSSITQLTCINLSLDPFWLDHIEA